MARRKKLYNWSSDLIDTAHELARSRKIPLNKLIDQLIERESKTDSGKTVQEEIDMIWDELGSLQTYVDKISKRLEDVEPYDPNGGFDE